MASSQRLPVVTLMDDAPPYPHKHPDGLGDAQRRFNIASETQLCIFTSIVLVV
jgi:hypothetical protein